MNTSEMIRIQCVKLDNISDAELGRRCGWTSSNVHDRLKRNSWKVEDLEKVAAALNCSLQIDFVPRK